MKLQELQQGNNLIIKVNVKDKKIEFPSLVAFIEKEYILIDPVRIDGKIINFTGEHIRVDMICVRQGKAPIIWNNVLIEVVDYKKSVYYRVKAFSDGLETNRREAFRMFIGIEGVAQLGANRKAVNVIAKDVSESGFSFVTAEDVEPAINVPVRMVFMDLDKQFSIVGMIVRKVVIAENKILYGCSMKESNTDIIKYINTKQRQQLAMNKGNAAYKTKKMLEESLQETHSVAEIFIEDAKKNNRVNQNKDGKRAINQVSDKQERRDVFKYKNMGKRV